MSKNKMTPEIAPPPRTESERRHAEQQLGARVVEILRHYRDNARHMGAPLAPDMRRAFTEEEIRDSAHSLGLLDGGEVSRG